MRKYLSVCITVVQYSTSTLIHTPCNFPKANYSLIFILTWTLFGCATTRSVVSPPIKIAHLLPPPSTSLADPLKQLQNSIDSILSDSIFMPVHASVKVVSLDSEKVLYQHESNALLNPASNIKLITSAAALFVLDTNYQFKTCVFVDDTSADNDFVPNIYLKGYGDPNLVTSDLDSLACTIRNFGIRTINNIIVDGSFFDDNYWGAGWSWDDESDPDAPYINALSVNSNCININVITNSNNISVSLEPNTDFVTVSNKAAIVLDSVRSPLKIRRLSLDNGKAILLIEGDIYRYSQVTQKFALRCPQFYAGALFKESLRRAGISVSGEIVSGMIPDGIHEIAQHRQPIEKVIETMNKQSDNLAAENTLKLIGALKMSVPGSTKNGVFIEKNFLSFLGMDTTKFSLVDGSGSSRYNLLSADQLVQFLVAMNKQPRLFSMFYNSLPIAGIDGTLANRMNNYPVAGNLRAKTGTLIGASCLSGYVQTRDGEMLAFAILMQNFITSSSEYRRAQDRIGSLLGGFSRTIITQTGSTKEKTQ